MTEWRIGLSPQAAKGTPSILGPLTALMAWQRLTKASQAAVVHGYKYAAMTEPRVWLGHRDLCPSVCGLPCDCPCSHPDCPGVDRCQNPECPRRGALRNHRIDPEGVRP